ncbi:hypothetical protein [Corticibacter populi]|uniref:hypothetical protein n=1 Tax=Corticibacter populi TaxID=1550736 RepID=UPI00102B8E4E|nr:hypothetical protein [Corticibacter populi]RZS33828.1 hypothetical protein EV687_2155 [Corticibacter populi]
MESLSNQDTRRSAYVDTRKTGNAEWADFSWHPAGLEPERAARSVDNPRKAYGLAAVAASRSAPPGSNAISSDSVDRP